MLVPEMALKFALMLKSFSIDWTKFLIREEEGGGWRIAEGCQVRREEEEGRREEAMKEEEGRREDEGRREGEVGGRSRSGSTVFLMSMETEKKESNKREMLSRGIDEKEGVTNTLV